MRGLLPSGLLLAVALSLEACTRGPVPPAKVFVEFVASVASGDDARAWDLLSEDTQAAATALGARAKPPVDGRRALFGGGLSLGRRIDTVEILEIGKARAKLDAVAADGSSMQVEMRLEHGRWRVYLPL